MDSGFFNCTANRRKVTIVGMRTLLLLIVSVGALFAQPSGPHPGNQTKVNFPEQVTKAPMYVYSSVSQLPTVCDAYTPIAIVGSALYKNQATAPNCSWAAWDFNNTPTLLDFGCTGDGATNDGPCAQLAVDALQGLNRALNIPAGFTFCLYTPIVIRGSITLNGGGTLKRCANMPTGKGLIDITASNVYLQGFTIEGATTTPQVYINYNLNPNLPSPFDATLTKNTSIWIHAGSSYVTVGEGPVGAGITINHTGGYAALIDARTANINHISFVGNTVKNSRSGLNGTPNDYKYGSWTGGFLWTNNGYSTAINDLLFERNRMLQVTGNAIWGHTDADGVHDPFSMQNSNVRVLHNYFEDMGLDAIQMQNVNGGIVANNTGKRIGYVSLVDDTPGQPYWQPPTTNLPPKPPYIPGTLYFSVPAVALDNSALVTGVEYANNDFDCINGEWFNGDGFGYGNIYPGTVTSCHASRDPFAQKTRCGVTWDSPVVPQPPPLPMGTNVESGLSTGDSSASFAADVHINIVGGTFNGFGGGAIHLYGCVDCTVSSTTIVHPNDAYSSPISYGPFTIAARTIYPTRNKIENNLVYWSPTTGALVVEDPSYAAFISSNTNIVRGNLCVGDSGSACYELAKAPVTTTGSGPLVLSSVTPGACPNPSVPYSPTGGPNCIIETHTQTEGTDSGTYVERTYADIGGTGFLLRGCTLDTCAFQTRITSQQYIRPGQVPYATYTCSPALVGAYVTITDSNTVTWGANIAGGGTNRVFAFCNGSNWTVAGK